MERALQVRVSESLSDCYVFHVPLSLPITDSDEEIGKAIDKVTPVSYSQKIVSFACRYVNSLQFCTQ